MLLAVPTLSDSATLTAGSEASDMPATNLQKMQPSSLWRATDLGNSYLVVDLGEFHPINVLALLYTNASSGATVQVRGADTEAELTSSPGYDSGSVDHWPVHGMETWAYTHFLHFPSTAQTYRWWRFDISDADNPDGFYEAGRLYIDNAFEPERGVRYGFNVRYKDGQVRGRALGNQIYPQQRNVGRILSGQIRWHSEADFWEEFSKLERLQGTAKDVLFVTDKTITARLMDWSAMGLFTDLEPLTHPTYGLYEANFNIEELLGVPLNVTALDPEISIADNSAAEDAGSITFTITRATNTQGACSVVASTADGTATAGNDYTAKTETINFADGETTKNFTVTLLDDATYEGNETFTVNLTKPIDCVITDSSATGTINEDESAPVVSVDATTYEVDEDAGTLQVQVNLVGVHAVAASVDYALNDGTAAAGTDYTDDSGTLNWAAGDTDPKTVNVAITDRGVDFQGSRDLTFDLSNPTDCTIGDAQATITINDQEKPLIAAGVIQSGTLTRNSTATYWDASSVLQSAAIDTARADYDPADGSLRGLLIEEARTNSLLDPRDPRPSGTNWSGSATVAIDAVGLDGAANSAATITDDDAGVFENIIQTISIPNDGNPVAQAIYIKKDSDTTRFPAFEFRLFGGTRLIQKIRFNTSTGAVVEVLSDGSWNVYDKGDWWLIEQVITNNSSGNTSARYLIQPAVSTDINTDEAAATGSIIYDYGGIELNASHATSPIVGTREADNATDNITTWPVPVSLDITATPSADQDGVLYQADDGTENNRVRFERISGNLHVIVTNGGTEQANLNMGALTDFTEFTVRAAFADNDIAASLNGAAVVTDSSATIPTGLTTHRYGKDTAGERWNAWIKDIDFDNERWTNGVLEA